MRKLTRYTQVRVNADGETVYRFNPPNKLIDKGITKRVSLGTDRNIALMQIGVLNEAIDEYYNNERLSNNISNNVTLYTLIYTYMSSYAFDKLKPKTQKDYKYFLSVAQKTLGRYTIKSIGTKLAKKNYLQWVSQGVTHYMLPIYCL